MCRNLCKTQARSHETLPKKDAELKCSREWGLGESYELTEAQRNEYHTRELRAKFGTQMISLSSEIDMYTY